MASQVNVIALMKDGERYLFLYDDNSIDTLLEQFGAYAGDEELNFTWHDAALLSQKLRTESRSRIAQED